MIPKLEESTNSWRMNNTWAKDWVRMVKDFVQFLFRDPKVTKIQADPALTNARAIRCYEKAGFRRVGPITTPDGPAMLMVIDCVRVPDETYSQGANRP